MNRLSMLLIVLVSLGVAKSHALDLGSLLASPLLDPNQAQEEMNQYIRDRIPTLTLPSSAEEWTRQSQAIRSRMLEEVVFRGAPESWKSWHAQAEWADTLETGKGYRIRKLRYEFLPGFWTTALLYEPEHLEGKFPAILNVNGHVGPPGKAFEEEQIRCINQAKRGVLALHPEWLSFGELQGKDNGHNNLAYLDLLGTSGLSVFYLLMRGGLDILVDYPHTDPERVGMTGLSGGGWQTIILSSLDTRILATVPNAGYIGLFERTQSRGDIGDLEQNPSDQLLVADFPQLTGLLAPRPALLIYNEKDDCCFKAPFAKGSVYDPVIPFYQLYDRSGDFEFHMNTDPGTHNYGLDNRQAFYRFLYKHFLPGATPDLSETQTPEEILKPEQLYAGLPENNASFYTLARDLHSSPRGNRPVLNQESVRDLLKAPSLVAQGEVAKASEVSGYRAQGFLLDLGDWSVPAVAIEKGPANGTLVVVGDEGRSALGTLVQERVDQGMRVVVIDPLFLGESKPGETPPWQYAQMVATVGERPLGVQAAQIAAIADWACLRFGDPDISILADGWTSQVAAQCAAVLSPMSISRVDATNRLASLYDLIEGRADYSEYPSLFCFGLLGHLDLSDLDRLHQELRARPVTIDLRSVAVNREKGCNPCDAILGRFKRLLAIPCTSAIQTPKR